MEHVAILNKKRDLLTKIISGEKTIESRWLKNKSAPWLKVKRNEMIYFKDSGEPVTVRATVKDVKYFYLQDENLEKLFYDYGKKIGFNSIEQLKEYSSGKNYCVLIFLKNVEHIEPFNIDKKGYGVMSAWICVDDINKIKK